LARCYATEQIDRTEEFALASLAAYEQWGHREFIAEAQGYLATVAVFRERPEAAMVYCEQAIATLTGMGMDDRMLGLLAQAAHIASIQGLSEKSRDYGSRHTALHQKITASTAYNQRGTMWRESTNLRRSLREVQRSHQKELNDMSARIDRILLATSTSGGLVLIIASMLLLRSKRRLEQVNARLEGAMQASQLLQEERAALQQNLQQIERLDSIGLLAGGFAHDFNNILVSVLGNAQLMLGSDNLDEEQRVMLDQIVQSGGRAAALCKDILSYAHAAPTPMSVIDLRELIAGIVPLAKSGFGAGVEVICELGDAARLIHGDRTQIEQVFLNALVNAGDSIKDRGRIELMIDSRELAGRPPSGFWFGQFTGAPRDCIAVTIVDNGEGMNPETIRRIFDPFFSTRFAGRGIGLAAVFGILRRHQGVVEVMSEPGKGTLLTIYLPQHQTAEQASDAILVPTPQRRPLQTTNSARSKVLVVDDEPAVCEVA